MTPRVLVALTVFAVALGGSSGAAASAATHTIAPSAALVATPQPVAAPQKRTLEGVVRVLAADTVEGQSPDHVFRGRSQDHYRQELVVGDRTYVLKGKKSRPNRRVRVAGAVSGNTVQAESVQDLGAAPAVVTSTGTTKVLVMLAHWNTPDSVTPESARAQLFGDSNSWFRDASYTALGQTGDVTPWLRISGPTNGACFGDSQNVMDQAKQAAATRGYNTADYTNFVVYSPNNSWQTGSDCNGFAGWAYVGAEGTWLNGYLDRRVTVHEQGHNYGLWHAHSYLCGEGAGSCSWSDYGDDFDAMGSSGVVGHFSASQKTFLGWMSGRTVDLSAGGSATLAPLASDPRVVGAAVVNVSASRAYWLEYRRALDFDSAQPAYGTDGVQVRLVDPTVGSGDTGANLLDVRPVDGASVSSATLRPGESWTSPEGYRFSTGSVTSTGAGVTVERGDLTPCPDAAAEPDDTAAQARGVALGSTGTHAFCTAGDLDWVSFSAAAGTSYRLETLNLATGTDTALGLYGPDGTTVLATNDDSNGTPASRIDFQPTAAGIYYLRAEQPDSSYGKAHTYDLRVSVVGDRSAPTVTARAPAVNATNAMLSGNITATFSEAVRGVTGTTFTLKNTTTGTPVNAVVTRNGTTNQWILNPAVNLAKDTRYTATLTGGTSAIRDTAGNPLASTRWSFTTRS